MHELECREALIFREKRRPAIGHPTHKKQHIIPRRSIERFYNRNSDVWIKLRSGKIFPAVSDNAVFCAKRTWEERSEGGHKINIEDAFQEVADKICFGELKTLNQTYSDRISAMFALWVTRSRLTEKPLTGLSTEELQGSNLASRWRSDERDQLEKAGFVVSDPDGAIHGRMMAWPHMQRQIAKIRADRSGIRWGILRAEASEFLLPDRCKDCLLPLSPKSFWSPDIAMMFFRLRALQKQTKLLDQNSESG